VQVRRDEAGAVIDVDDAAAQVEVVHQRDDAAGRCADGRAHGAGVVHARVPALDLTVEAAAVAEAAGDAALPRREERRLPQPRRAVRRVGHRAGAGRLAGHALADLRRLRPAELRCHAEPLHAVVAGGHHHVHAAAVAAAILVDDVQRQCARACRVQRRRGQRQQHAVLRLEVERCTAEAARGRRRRRHAALLLLPVRHDAATGRVFLTIPRLDEEMLHLNTLATGLGTTTASLDRGQVGNSAVVRFERRGARVLLVQPNTSHFAIGGDAALQQSVAESFPRSIVASFAVQSEGPDGVVVDATDFFLSDIYDVIGRLRGARLGTLRVDRDRSYIDRDRTARLRGQHRGPRGAHVRHRRPGGGAAAPRAGRTLHHVRAAAQLRAAAGPAAGHARIRPAGRHLHELVLRLRAGLRLRLSPARHRALAPRAVGHGRIPARRKGRAGSTHHVLHGPRHTRAVPHAFIEGGLWWNEMLGAAGWRDAFRIEPLPDGVDPMDARYPMIYWVHRQQRGPSVGPSFRDPRTGEIVGTVVRMDSHRSLVDHDIYMGLVPAAGAGGLQLDAQEFSMARRRQHTAHEIGHTLGLSHNFIAATQGRSSVMDYPYPLIRIDAERAPRCIGGVPPVRRRARHVGRALRVHVVPHARGRGRGTAAHRARRRGARAPLHRRHARRRGRLHCRAPRSGSRATT
jgi:hypothetical protein